MPPRAAPPRGTDLRELAVFGIPELRQGEHGGGPHRLFEGRAQHLDDDHVDVGVEQEDLVLHDGHPRPREGVRLRAVGAEEDQPGQGALGGHDVLQGGGVPWGDGGKGDGRVCGCVVVWEVVYVCVCGGGGRYGIRCHLYIFNRQKPTKTWGGGASEVEWVCWFVQLLQRAFGVPPGLCVVVWEVGVCVCGGGGMGGGGDVGRASVGGGGVQFCG